MLLTILVRGRVSGSLYVRQGVDAAAVQARQQANSRSCERQTVPQSDDLDNAAVDTTHFISL